MNLKSRIRCAMRWEPLSTDNLSLVNFGLPTSNVAYSLGIDMRVASFGMDDLHRTNWIQSRSHFRLAWKVWRNYQRERYFYSGFVNVFCRITQSSTRLFVITHLQFSDSRTCLWRDLRMDFINKNYFCCLIVFRISVFSIFVRERFKSSG